MPNNYNVALQRTLNLAGKFKKNCTYAEEYKVFMENVLQKGYAEKVPQAQVQRNDGHAMYYKVQVQQNHRDFLRFLWWPEGDISKPLEVYRMKVHLFGTVSSPSIANFALKQTGRDHSDQYSNEVFNTIKNSFYVDDCLKSVVSTSQAIKLTKDLMEACAQGGFTLTKWVSNSQEVVAQLDLDKEKPPLERVLGIQWDIQRDTFGFSVSIQDRVPTWRTIFSIVSSIYDPLGFLSPFILKAKQILQKVCMDKCGWDEVIPEHLAKPWKQWIAELDQLSRFEVDRCIKPESFGLTRTAELHHFCDASETGYGTASYLRLTNDKADVHVTFVLGKSRVIPLKQITIPRLELAAASLAVKVDRMLQRELHMELQVSTFWTDSTSVLKYIHNKTKRFHTYVANRQLVQRKSMAARKLKGQSSRLCFTRIEDGNVFGFNTMVEGAVSDLIEHFSSWKKLQRAVGWLLKLKRLLLLKSQKVNERVTNTKPAEKPTDEHHGLSVEDLDEAEKSVISYEQQRYFASELTLLRKGKPNHKDWRKDKPIGSANKLEEPDYSSQRLPRLQIDSARHPSAGWTCRKKPHALQARPEVLVTLFHLSCQENNKILCFL
ncbi:hypothetical protein N1851_022806 [Merluccius polli]|uniref:Uncharacterized protein n=1 Tax=Merluccius polli TaxID=89951 RepID=A0AA47MH62_MERPO|nr:hypothetical protein N1851_022806 [Merluccius polli]